MILKYLYAVYIQHLIRLYRHFDYQFNLHKLRSNEKNLRENDNNWSLVIKVKGKRQPLCIGRNTHPPTQYMHLILYDAKRYLIIFNASTLHSAIIIIISLEVSMRVKTYKAVMMCSVCHICLYKIVQLDASFISSLFCLFAFFAFNLHINHLRNISVLKMKRWDALAMSDVERKKERKKNYYIKF